MDGSVSADAFPENYQLDSQSMSTDMFIATIRQYTRAKKLTTRMLNELIERIEVHQSEKIDGEWVKSLQSTITVSEHYLFQIQNHYLFQT